MEKSPGPQAPGLTQPSGVGNKTLELDILLVWCLCLLSCGHFLTPSPIKEGLFQVSVFQYRPSLACRSLVSNMQLFLEPWDMVLGPKGSLLPAHVTSLRRQSLSWTQTMARAEGRAEATL